MTGFLEDFFKTIDNKGRVKVIFIDNARTIEMFIYPCNFPVNGEILHSQKMNVHGIKGTV